MFFRVVPNELNNPSLTTQQVERLIQFTKILTPHAYRQIEAMYGSGPFQSYARFAHYTSAESALEIIRSKRFWMRNVTCMSDFTEVQRGFEIIQKIFGDESYRTQFINAFDACVPGVAEAALGFFEKSGTHLRLNTFITSISEQGNDEDINGRLSMWRAFGGSSGRVALVVRIPAVSTASLRLKLRFSPVAYLTEEQTRDVVLEIIHNVKTNQALLSSLEPAFLVELIFEAIVQAAVCLKHEGFREEREWRTIYFPKATPSDLMVSSVQTIAGVPQTIFSIPLDESAHGLPDFDLTQMFDRLIIGPTQYPWAMEEAFITALNEAGIPDAKKRVCVSGIPIRF